MARTPVATDNFNRANGNVEVGNANWQQQNINNGNITIDTNILNPFISPLSAGTVNQAQAHYTAGSWTTDQYSQVSIPAWQFGQDGLVHGMVTVRASGVYVSNASAIYFYSAELIDVNGTAGGAKVVVGKCVAGTFSVLQTYSAAGFAPGDNLSLEAVGTSITAYKNTTALGTAITDSAIDGTATGASAGVGGGGDNWEGGTIAAAASNWGRMLGGELNRLVRRV